MLAQVILIIFIARYVERPPGPDSFRDTRGYGWTYVEGPGICRLDVDTMVNSFSADERISKDTMSVTRMPTAMFNRFVRAPGRFSTGPWREIPPWSRLRVTVDLLHLPPDEKPPWRHMTEFRIGWPLATIVNVVESSRGEVMHPNLSGMSHVLLRGFILNSAVGGAFIGVSYWLVCLIVRQCRQWRWRSRGLCRNCGYLWGKLPVCPECGHRRVDASASPA